MEHGVKIVAISKSGEGSTPPKEKKSSEKHASKAESAPTKETTKEPSLPQANTKSPSELQSHSFLLRTGKDE